MEFSAQNLSGDNEASAPNGFESARSQCETAIVDRVQSLGHKLEQLNVTISSSISELERCIHMSKQLEELRNHAIECDVHISHALPSFIANGCHSSLSRPLMKLYLSHGHVFTWMVNVKNGDGPDLFAILAIITDQDDTPDIDVRRSLCDTVTHLIACLREWYESNIAQVRTKYQDELITFLRLDAQLTELQELYTPLFRYLTWATSNRPRFKAVRRVCMSLATRCMFVKDAPLMGRHFYKREELVPLARNHVEETTQCVHHYLVDHPLYISRNDWKEILKKDPTPDSFGRTASHYLSIRLAQRVLSDMERDLRKPRESPYAVLCYLLYLLSSVRRAPFKALIVSVVYEAVHHFIQTMPDPSSSDWPRPGSAFSRYCVRVFPPSRLMNSSDPEWLGLEGLDAISSHSWKRTLWRKWSFSLTPQQVRLTKAMLGGPGGYAGVGNLWFEPP